MLYHLGRYFYSAGPAHWLWEVPVLPAASLPLLSEVQLHNSCHFPTGVPDGGSGIITGAYPFFVLFTQLIIMYVIHFLKSNTALLC